MPVAILPYNGGYAPRTGWSGNENSPRTGAILCLVAGAGFIRWQHLLYPRSYYKFHWSLPSSGMQTRRSHAARVLSRFARHHQATFPAAPAAGPNSNQKPNCSSNSRPLSSLTQRHFPRPTRLKHHTFEPVGQICWFRASCWSIGAIFLSNAAAPPVNLPRVSGPF